MTATKPRTADPYGGTGPRRVFDPAEEWRGGAAVPYKDRHGWPIQMTWVWGGPNSSASSVFIGTLGTLLLLGFWPAEWAIIVGILIGAAPVALLTVMGPRFGTPQMMLARFLFGRTSWFPAMVQWASMVGWTVIETVFGAQALSSLAHIPFLAAAACVIFPIMVISVRGYEAVTAYAQTAAVVIMTVMFGLLTWRIASHPHLVLAHSTVHGGAAVGAWLAMVAIAAAGIFSWAAGAADVSRYLPEDSRAAAVSGWSFAGLVLPYVWLATLGNWGASILTDQTGSGIATVIGGGIPELRMAAAAAVTFAAVTGTATDDYMGGLAAQAGRVRVRRPYLSAVSAVIAFALVAWIGNGAAAVGRITNVLLLSVYWCAPLAAMIGAHYWLMLRADRAPFARARAVPEWVDNSLRWEHLPRWGWKAGVVLAVSFGLMLPFMNQSYMHGIASEHLGGADLALYVGALAGAGLWTWLAWPEIRRAREAGRTAVPVPAQDEPV